MRLEVSPPVNIFLLAALQFCNPKKSAESTESGAFFVRRRV